MTAPLKIRRTHIATTKLKEIYRYSRDHWGEKIAGKYMEDLEAAIQQASREQGGTSNNPEFSTRFTFTPVRKHFIFFEVRNETLFIATIFHSVMDIRAGLAAEMAEIQSEMDDGKTD